MEITSRFIYAQSLKGPLHLHFCCFGISWSSFPFPSCFYHTWRKSYIIKLFRLLTSCKSHWLVELHIHQPKYLDYPFHNSRRFICSKLHSCFSGIIFPFEHKNSICRHLNHVTSQRIVPKEPYGSLPALYVGFCPVSCTDDGYIYCCCIMACGWLLRLWMYHWL